MSTDTKIKVIEAVKKTFATQGYEAISMRTLAKDVGISQSVLYHHFECKDQMLEEIFEFTRKDIGRKRSLLEDKNTFNEDMKERVTFQFDNALDVIFILKYFFHYKDEFPKNEQGFVPVQAYKHIEEVLERWINELVIKKDAIPSEAKVITHAINGFVLEYYPNTPTGKEKRDLINSITNFVNRSLLDINTKGGDKRE